MRYRKRDKFVIFNRVSCEYYLNQMKSYALRDLKDEAKKMRTNFRKFSKIIDNIYDENKILPLEFFFNEIKRIDKKDSAIFYLRFIGDGELLETFPQSIKPLKLPIIKKEGEIIFHLKKNKIEIDLKLKNYLKNLHEISKCLKKEVEIYNCDLQKKLKIKGMKLYKKNSSRGW